ncbi:MAG TPA: hypothetical protein VFZ76_00515 [Anaerolineales bacterium]
MNRNYKTNSWVVGTAIVLVGFSIAHVLEDFVYGIPAQFGFETAPAAALLGIAYAMHVVLIVLAARGSKLGVLGNLAAGIAWVLAAAIDHLDEILFVQPYRAGWLSKGFEIGLMLSALALAITSFLAWRAQPRQETIN